MKKMFAKRNKTKLKKQLKFAKLYKFEIYAKTSILRKIVEREKQVFYGPNKEK
jgi:hypothetical protein